jgi:hypothetical protein
MRPNEVTARARAVESLEHRLLLRCSSLYKFKLSSLGATATECSVYLQVAPSADESDSRTVWKGFCSCGAQQNYVNAFATTK